MFHKHNHLLWWLQVIHHFRLLIITMFLITLNERFTINSHHRSFTYRLKLHFISCSKYKLNNLLLQRCDDIMFKNNFGHPMVRKFICSHHRIYDYVYTKRFLIKSRLFKLYTNQLIRDSVHVLYTFFRDYNLIILMHVQWVLRLIFH